MWHWLQHYRARHSQRFLVTYTVTISPDQVIAIPYPINRPQQTVTNMYWQTDGDYTDHGGSVVVEHASQITMTASVVTQPFHRQFASPIHPDIKECYDQTVRTLRYGAPIPGLYTLAQVHTLPEVDCGGFSVYLLSLLADHHMTARLVAGFWAGYDSNTMHAWVECELPDGTWLPLDPSTDWLRQRGRTKKIGGFGEIGSDRIVINVGTTHELVVHEQRYAIGMLQLPMILQDNGTFTYLSHDHYRLITQR